MLDCSTEKIQPFLKQAMQLGMMTAYHNYLITSLVSQSHTTQQYAYDELRVAGKRYAVGLSTNLYASLWCGLCRQWTPECTGLRKPSMEACKNTKFILYWTLVNQHT